MRPSLIEPAFFDIITAGQFLGIVRAIQGDPDPARTQRNQVQRMYWLVHRKKIPFVKKGSRVYFEKAALETWMRSGAHLPWQTSSHSSSPTSVR
jgi:excisionase family DNA binding protein